MRLDGDATSDLVIFQDGSDAPSALVSAAARTFVVNDAGDDPDCDLTDNACRIGPVDTTGKCTGGCKFRAALNEANVSGDLDAIEFALGGGTPTIMKRGGADWIATSPITINGNTGGATRVHLDAGGAGNTLIVRGGSSAIRNLVITGGSPGINVSINGGNLFEGNWIGLDPSGTSAPGNPGQGMLVVTPNNTIGGTTSAARNVVSGSGLNGIEIRNATGNRVLGNFIGTDASGTLDLGNALSGVYVELSGSTTIGGTAAGSRNVISGNDDPVNGGILANISPNLAVQGNYIGTTATGNAALANAGPGLRLVSGSNDIIGGSTGAARNVIAANGADGVVIRSIGVSAKTAIQGNYIGVAANGTLLGNAGFGITIQGTHDNAIGGTANGAGNVIGGNGSAGVALQFAGSQPVGNLVRGNSIGSNGALGIDLGADGVTPNDVCDADTGANGRQNAPVLTSAPGLGALQGTLNSRPSTTFGTRLLLQSCGRPVGIRRRPDFPRFQDRNDRRWLPREPQRDVQQAHPGGPRGDRDCHGSGEQHLRVLRQRGCACGHRRYGAEHGGELGDRKRPENSVVAQSSRQVAGEGRNQPGCRRNLQRHRCVGQEWCDQRHLQLDGHRP